MAHRLSRSLAALLIACPASAWIHAAEIGDAHVASHIGQQLVADVELTSLENAGAPVQARLASADVYRGASIAMPPVLASLNMSVMRRDGRQFLHLTSLKPVDSDHLHVFLELADGGQRSVRLATLWLSPDPNPAPLPVPDRASASVAAAAAAGAPSAAAPAATVPAAAAMAATAAAHAANPAPAAVATPRPVPVHAIAPAAGMPAAPAQATAASAPTAKPAPAHVEAALVASRPPAPPAQAHVEPGRVAARPPAGPAQVPLHAVASAACPQPFSSAQVQACVALDGKNAALREQVGQLEWKVTALQAAIGGAGAAVPGPAHQAAPPAQPAPAKLALPAKPSATIRAQKKRQAEQKPLPWLWIGLGAALLAAGGGALVAVRRIRAVKAGKAKAKAATVVTPGVMGGIKSRLMTDPPAAERAAEPAIQ